MSAPTDQQVIDAIWTLFYREDNNNTVPDNRKAPHGTDQALSVAIQYLEDVRRARDRRRAKTDELPFLSGGDPPEAA